MPPKYIKMFYDQQSTLLFSMTNKNINSNNLDNPRQSAYKSGHSTETALLLIKNEIHLSLSRGEPTALVLLDLSAAFDTIDHPTLLNCLAQP